MSEDIPNNEPTASDDGPGADLTAPAPVPEPMAGLAVTPTRDLGLMLVSAGLIGVVLPGPGAPALLAGGLMLWPGAFGKVERWVHRRYPEAHRKGMGHINRFLSDLERRYPGSTGTTGEPPRSGPA